MLDDPMSIPQSEVDALRLACLEAIEKENESFVHPIDLDKVKTNDLWLRRFLMHHESNQKLALEMLISTLKWRQSFGVNEINESNIKMDYLIEGGVFPHGRDIDGHLIFIFHCKKHVKGQKDLDELKRCLVYWLERLEREEHGKGLTVFFDLEACGLSNMDLEFTKYVITLFKDFYPWFLNYIIVYEMAWILNAVFKLIKSWLPPKAVERIKTIKKAEISQWVPLEQALTKWGGQDDYTFTFLPENFDETFNNNSTNSKKVHFADASPMSESPGPGGDRENGETNSKMLTVTPPNVITFNKDGNELVSVLELQNNDPTTIVSFKMKTTAPEKFRVRPSVGYLMPGGKDTISVTLLQGFAVRSLARDKFLLMSMPVESADLSPQAFADLWKNTSNKNVSQYRLRCAQPDELPRNGNAVMVPSSDPDEERIKKLTSNLTNLLETQKKLERSLERTQIFQLVTVGLTVIVALLLMYFIRSEMRDIKSSQSCYQQP